jgi:hypothetical protein
VLLRTEGATLFEAGQETVGDCHREKPWSYGSGMEDEDGEVEGEGGSRSREFARLVQAATTVFMALAEGQSLAREGRKAPQRF